jgi:hypothetical protein
MEPRSEKNNQKSKVQSKPNITQKEVHQGQVDVVLKCMKEEFSI